MNYEDLGFNKFGRKEVGKRDLLTSSVDTDASLESSSIVSKNIIDLTVDSINIADGSITSSKIADGAVTTNKIANLNVTNGKLANTSVDNNKLSTDAVTTIKIQDAAVTYRKLTYGGADSNINTLESTASTSYVLFTTPDTINITLDTAQKCLIEFSVVGDANDASFVGVKVDAVNPTDYSKKTLVVSNDGLERSYSRSYIETLTSGAHTISLVGKVKTAGTLNVQARYLLIIPIGG